METQHVLELGAGGVSWAAEEQMLPATIPRLTSRVSPASRDKAVGAPEVSEGHGAGGEMQHRWGGGKGPCLTEMILWGTEGWGWRESCNDAHSRVGAKECLSLRGFGCLVAQGLPTPSCLLGSRDSISAAHKSHGRGINGGRSYLPLIPAVALLLPQDGGAVSVIPAPLLWQGMPGAPFTLSQKL